MGSHRELSWPGASKGCGEHDHGLHDRVVVFGDLRTNECTGSMLLRPGRSYAWWVENRAGVPQRVICAGGDLWMSTELGSVSKS